MILSLHPLIFKERIVSLFKRELQLTTNKNNLNIQSYDYRTGEKGVDD